MCSWSLVRVTSTWYVTRSLGNGNRYADQHTRQSVSLRSRISGSMDNHHKQVRIDVCSSLIMHNVGDVNQIVTFQSRGWCSDCSDLHYIRIRSVTDFIAGTDAEFVASAFSQFRHFVAVTCSFVHQVKPASKWRKFIAGQKKKGEGGRLNHEILLAHTLRCLLFASRADTVWNPDSFHRPIAISNSCDWFERIPNAVATEVKDEYCTSGSMNTVPHRWHSQLALAI